MLDSIKPSGASRLLAVSSRCPTELAAINEWSLSDFVLVKKVGVGGASAVYQGVLRRTGLCVALKLYFKSKMTALNVHQVHREIAIHSRLSHENIISLYGAFEDQEYVVLVIEYAGKGDLFDLLRNTGGRMKESDVVRRILAPFMRGLSHLHGHGVIHRDIKLENTLFAADWTLKIADFGLSIDAASELPVTRLGTLDYMSPEVMVCPDKRTPRENKQARHLAYTAKVDAWACGVLAFELLVGCPPFGMSTREASVHAILYQNPKLPGWLPAPAVDFIQHALTKSPRDRPSVAQLLQHPWIASHMAPLGAAMPCSTQAASLSAHAGARVAACGQDAAVCASAVGAGHAPVAAGAATSQSTGMPPRSPASPSALPVLSLGSVQSSSSGINNPLCRTEGHAMPLFVTPASSPRRGGAAVAAGSPGLHAALPSLDSPSSSARTLLSILQQRNGSLNGGGFGGGEGGSGAGNARCGGAHVWPSRGPSASGLHPPHPPHPSQQQQPQHAAAIAAATGRMSPRQPQLVPHAAVRAAAAAAGASAHLAQSPAHSVSSLGPSSMDHATQYPLPPGLVVRPLDAAGGGGGGMGGSVFVPAGAGGAGADGGAGLSPTAATAAWVSAAAQEQFAAAMSPQRPLGGGAVPRSASALQLPSAGNGGATGLCAHGGGLCAHDHAEHRALWEAQGGGFKRHGGLPSLDSPATERSLKASEAPTSSRYEVPSLQHAYGSVGAADWDWAHIAAGVAESVASGHSGGGVGPPGCGTGRQHRWSGKRSMSARCESNVAAALAALARLPGSATASPHARHAGSGAGTPVGSPHHCAGAAAAAHASSAHLFTPHGPAAGPHGGDRLMRPRSAMMLHNPFCSTYDLLDFGYPSPTARDGSVAAAAAATHIAPGGHAPASATEHFDSIMAALAAGPAGNDASWGPPSKRALVQNDPP